MSKFVCTICGFVYDESTGIPSSGIAPGTRWSDLPDSWVCPICGATKAAFEPVQDPQSQKANDANERIAPIEMHEGDLRALTTGELSALFSNLARGCEKQYLSEEAALFIQLADYFKARTPQVAQADPDALLTLLSGDLNDRFAHAQTAAKQQGDRGAQRALVWSEKVSRMIHSVLTRYQAEGAAFLQHTNIYVCSICGFLYVGDNPPELCPVCKVPSWKFEKVDGR